MENVQELSLSWLSGVFMMYLQLESEREGNEYLEVLTCLKIQRAEVSYYTLS